MGSEWKDVPVSQLYESRSGLSKPHSEFGFGYGFLSFKDVFKGAISKLLPILALG